MRRSAWRYESGSPGRPGPLEEKVGPPQGCNVAWGAVSSSTDPETQTEKKKQLNLHLQLLNYCRFTAHYKSDNPRKTTKTKKGILLVYLDNILPGHIVITLPLFLLLSCLLHTFWQPFILLLFLLLSRRQQREGGQAAKPGEGAVQTLLTGHPQLIISYTNQVFGSVFLTYFVIIGKRDLMIHCIASSCLTSSSAHTRSALRACTAADITPSTPSSNAKRSRKSRPASSRVDVTLPFRTDRYSSARACRVRNAAA